MPHRGAPSMHLTPSRTCPALLCAVAAALSYLNVAAASPLPPHVICNRPCMTEALLTPDDAAGCFTCSPSASSPATPAPTPVPPNNPLQEALHRMSRAEPDTLGTLHLLHAHAAQHAGTAQGSLAAVYEAVTLMQMGGYEAAISLLERLQQQPSDSVEDTLYAPSIRLRVDLPFHVAVLDNLAHSLDLIGSVAASCNHSSSAVAALSRHTRALPKGARSKFKQPKKHLNDMERACGVKLQQLSSAHAQLNNFPAAFARMRARDGSGDGREAAVAQLADMSNSLHLLHDEAQMRAAQGMVSVFESSSLSVQLMLLNTMHAAIFTGHSCIHFAKAAALSLLINVIESPHFPQPHKTIAIKLMSLTSACSTAVFTESRALHFTKRLVAAAATPDAQKYEAVVAIGHQFNSSLHAPPHPLRILHVSRHQPTVPKRGLGPGLWWRPVAPGAAAKQSLKRLAACRCA